MHGTSRAANVRSVRQDRSDRRPAQGRRDLPPVLPARPGPARRVLAMRQVRCDHRPHQDGAPLCNRCKSRPKKPCVHCGRIRIVCANTAKGPLCKNCHPHHLVNAAYAERSARSLAVVMAVPARTCAKVVVATPVNASDAVGIGADRATAAASSTAAAVTRSASDRARSAKPCNR